MRCFLLHEFVSLPKLESSRNVTSKVISNCIKKHSKEIKIQRIWLQAFLPPRHTCNSMAELSNSMGWGFESTIKFNASTGEKYCEWFVCGTKVAFDLLSTWSKLKQVGFTVSSKWKQFCLALHCCWIHWHKKMISWSRTWSISWHLHSRICSHNRTAKHIEISCLPWE